jgi:NADPH-dependent 2,4-dienoyl-CoA reductase/sulfur reductase-like enzyme
MNNSTTQQANYTVVGAGPAGMAVATKLAAAGKQVTVIDLASSPGGQIYRHVVNAKTKPDLLGPDYHRGKKLVDEFLASTIDYQPNCRVWWLEKTDTGYRLGIKSANQVSTLETQKLIIATGAIERPLPFEGWQLPGVMTAGSAQILIKQSALIPASPPVLVGSGPLLYLLAHQLMKADAPPLAVLDCSPSSSFLQPMKYPLRSWFGRKYLFKGVLLMAALKMKGVKLISGVSDISAQGDTEITSVTYRQKNQTKTLACNLLLTHFGVIPEPQTARALNVPFNWHDQQMAFVPDRKEEQFSVDENLWMIGDCAGINGAINAELEGDLLAARLLNNSNQTIAGKVKDRLHENAIRPVLEAMFKPPENWLAQQSPETIICRCESVSLQNINEAMANGAQTANHLKTFTRCGMGSCQGRMCGTAVSQILAAHSETTLDQVGYYRIRTPINPITLGDLGALNNNHNNKAE